MSFSLTPKTAFPRPQADGFPQGIQWEADGTPLGDRHVQTVDLRSFGSGGVTRDGDTLTVVAPAAGGGGGGGSGPIAVFSAYRSTTNQTSGSTAIFNAVSGSGAFENEAGYDETTGVFTAQVDDIYCFRTQIVPRDSAEPTFAEAIIAIVIGVEQAAYGYGFSFPDPAAGNEQIPFPSVSVGPIFLAAGTQVKVVRADDVGANPNIIAFNSTIRVMAHPASRFECWRFGT